MAEFVVRTIDYHTAGEPFRIVADPPVDLSGDSVADRRARAMVDQEANRLRHAGAALIDMEYGVPPDRHGVAAKRSRYARHRRRPRRRRDSHER